MLEILKSMLELQEKLQVFTNGEDWRVKRLNYPLAISQEASELIDHLGWKWWMKQVVNREAAKVEVIDILHFALAFYLARHEKEEMEFASHRAYDDLHHRQGRHHFDNQLYVLTNAEEDPVLVARIIQGWACAGKVNIGVIFLLGEILGMSLLQQATLYRAKATLNTFRQEHGYKQGTYKKIWVPSTIEGVKGLEDNDVMQEVSNYVDWKQPNASQELYRLLELRYADVA